MEQNKVIVGKEVLYLDKGDWVSYGKMEYWTSELLPVILERDYRIAVCSSENKVFLVRKQNREFANEDYYVVETRNFTHDNLQSVIDKLITDCKSTVT